MYRLYLIIILGRNDYDYAILKHLRGLFSSLHAYFGPCFFITVGCDGLVVSPTVGCIGYGKEGFEPTRELVAEGNENDEG